MKGKGNGRGREREEREWEGKIDWIKPHNYLTLARSRDVNGHVSDVTIPLDIGRFLLVVLWFSASGGLAPLTPHQGLCPWTPLGAQPPDPIIDSRSALTMF